ncbi:MAG: M56 family metallopeptidase [Mariniblastus sp.]
MSVLFEISIANAFWASVLAVVVCCITAKWKNCFAAHFLWLVVLAKLIMPPIWQQPIPIPILASAAPPTAIADSFDFQSDMQPNLQANVSSLSTVNLKQVQNNNRQTQSNTTMENDETNTTNQPVNDKEDTLFQSGSAHVTIAASQQSPNSSGDSAPALPVIDWIACVFVVWVAGSLVVVFMTLHRLISFDRSLRQSSSDNDFWQQRVEQLAETIGLTRVPRVRTTSARISPLIWCVGHKPTLVLPIELMDSLAQDQSDPIIVHELAHLLRRSHWIRWFELFVTSVYWWHPVVWWARHQLHQADETCCDSIVLQHFPDSNHSYCESLFRTAKFLVGATNQAPLAFNFSHFKFLKRRMEIVLRDQPSVAVSRTAKISLATFAAVVLIFSARMFASPNNSTTENSNGIVDSSKDQQQSASQKLVVNVVNPDGTPASDVSVKLTMGVKDIKEESFRTDAKGNCIIVHDGLVPGAKFTITVESAGHTPMKSTWTTKAEQDLPTSLKFHLETASTMGGVVLDENQTPIPGIDVFFAASSSSQTDTRITLTSLKFTCKTDKQGRWKCDKAPPYEKIAHVVLGFTSEKFVDTQEFVSRQDWTPLRVQTYKTKLQSGYKIFGTVTDSKGNPIHLAQVVVGALREPNLLPISQTDMSGQYQSNKISEGVQYVTCVADGFAPAIQKVNVARKDLNLDLQLSTGIPLTIEVKDSAGKPLAGARAIPFDWRNGRSLIKFGESLPLTANANGVIKWENAPSEPIKYLIRWPGLMRRDVKLAPNSTPYKCVLYPPLKVAFKVQNKETKSPATEFRLLTGFKGGDGKINWRRHETLAGKDGELEWTQRNGNADSETYFRIEADGMKAVETRAVKLSEGVAELEVFMEPAETKTISIIAPNGKLSKNATVYYCLPRRSNGPYVRNGATVKDRKRLPKLTFNDGKFELPNNSEKAKIVILADEGYAKLAADKLQTTDRVELLGWSRVEGVAKIGAKPADGETIKLTPQFESGWYMFDYGVKADKDGKFIFDCVPADMKAPYIYRQIIVSRDGSGFESTSAFSHPLILKPGKTTKVELGGIGRAVTGKLVAPPEYPNAVADWNLGTTNLRRTIVGPAGERSEYHGFAIKPDGTFRIEDVPPGTYQFQAQVLEEGEVRWKPGPEIGSMTQQFVIEPMEGGRSDEAFDLGNLQLK